MILRRAEAGSPSGLTLAFEAANDAEALAAYNEWEDAQHDRTYRNAERRANWGPLGTGKMK